MYEINCNDMGAVRYAAIHTKLMDITYKVHVQEK